MTLVCLTTLHSVFFSSLIYGLTAGAIYALFALGYSMVYGILGLINFAHSEVFMIGTYAALGVMVVTAPLIGSYPAAIVLVLAATAAILASGAIAMGLELAAFRPLRLRGAPRHAAMITGMGISIFLQEVFALRYGRNVLAFPSIWKTTTVLHIGDAALTNTMLLIFGSTIVMLLMVDKFVGGTRLGRGMRAVSQEPRAAILMGVDTSTVILVTFLVGGLCAGLGGYLYGMYYGQTIYNVGFVPGIKAFAAAVLGGIGNLRGAVVGGLILGLVENYGVACMPSQLEDVIAFTILVLVLMFRPTGVLGERLPGR